MPTPATDFALRNARARVRSWLVANPALYTPTEHEQAIAETDACTDLEELDAMEQVAMQRYHERAGVTV